MSIETMKMALEVLEQINQLSIGENAIALPGEIDAAMDNLRAAIEQAEKRQWVGLTAEEIWACYKTDKPDPEYYILNALDFAEAIEAKLKEKNT
jgi:hypothetical protein